MTRERLDYGSPEGCAVSSELALTAGAVIPKSKTYGIKVDTGTPTFGWRDLEGPIRPRETGVGRPTLATWRTPIKEYVFAAGDIAEFEFHWPHDYVDGSDVYVHVHWSHSGTNISGAILWDFIYTFAKGHQQAVFPAATTLSMSLPSTSITTYPQYQHNISEFQLSSSAGGGGRSQTRILSPTD